jgi:hypothetical protein
MAVDDRDFFLKRKPRPRLLTAILRFLSRGSDSLNAYLYTFIYIYYTYICIHVYMYLHICTHVCVHLSLFIARDNKSCLPSILNTHTYAYLYTHASVQHIHMHICVHWSRFIARNNKSVSPSATIRAIFTAFGASAQSTSSSKSSPDGCMYA